MPEDRNVENLESNEEEVKEDEEKADEEQDQEDKDDETGEEPGGDDDQMTPRELAMQAQIDMLTNTVSQITGQEGDLDKKGKEEMSSVLDDLEDFLADDAAYEKATGSREGLNELLEQVVERTVVIVAEHTSKGLPDTISAIVKRHVAEELMGSEFFRANQDLMPQRKFVAFVMNELMTANPGMGTQEILDKKLGPEVRARLGMKKGKGKDRQSTAPNLKAGGSRQTPRKPTSIASEIAELKDI